MGGIGVSVDSQEKGKGSRSKPLIGLPPEVADAIAETLGIATAKTKRALTAGKLALPEGVAVTITRKKTKDTLTVKKLKGTQYRVTYKGKSRTIKL